MSQPPPSIYDAPIAAALGLGFHARVYGADALNDCLLTLVHEIHPNVYTSLNRLIAAMDASYELFETAREEPRGQTRPLPEWEPNLLHTDALCRFANRAFADGSPWWRWYRVGAALGDCELADRRGELAAEQCDLVVNYLQRLPKQARSDIIVIKRLLEIDRSAAPVDVFNQALESVPAEREASIPLPPMSIIARCASAIMAGVQQLPLSLQDGRQDARDRWLYEQTRDGVAYKSIIAQLKSFNDWEPIDSAPGISRAVKRFAERKGLLPLQTRQPGRPRGKK